MALAGSESGSRASITARFVELLSRDASPLLATGEVERQLVAQLHGVLDDTFAALGVIDAQTVPAAPEGTAEQLSAEIGEVRAVSGIHPSQSLHAAGLLFEAALPVVAKAAEQAGSPSPEIAASLALNRAITRRMTVAAEFYIGFLLQKIHESNTDERRRISRELHDVVAPSIVLGLQNLRLYETYADTDAVQAQRKLSAAARGMTDAMAAVRALAAETRESLSRNGLQYALAHVLARKPAGVLTKIEIVGPTQNLSPTYREELFLIVQEAIRNAFAHAHPTTVEVSLRIDDHQVVGTVSDDGRGFEFATEEQRAGGLGLTSMRERAALLGGVVGIRSGPGQGTLVTAHVPLPPRTNLPNTATGTRS